MQAIDAIEKEGSTVEEALEKALQELNKELHEIEYDVLDEGESESSENGSEKVAIVRAWAKNPEEVAKSKEILQDILKSLTIDGEVTVDYNRKDNCIYLNIQSDDAGILIGRQGQTLDSLQYLLQLILNLKDIGLMLDVADYRDRHRQHLVSVVEKIAERVLRKRRRITLKPMDSKDRKIVHEALKLFPELISSSIGIEPNRRVVISLKRADLVTERSRPGGGGNRYNSRYNRNQPRSSSFYS